MTAARTVAANQLTLPGLIEDDCKFFPVNDVAWQVLVHHPDTSEPEIQPSLRSGGATAVAHGSTGTPCVWGMGYSRLRSQGAVQAFRFRIQRILCFLIYM